MRGLKLSVSVGFQQFGLAKPGTVPESPAHLLHVYIFLASSCHLQIAADLLVAQVFNASSQWVNSKLNRLNQCRARLRSL